MNKPVIPRDLALQTKLVLMRPMESTDFSEFVKLAQDEDAFRFFTLTLQDPQQLKQGMNAAFKERKADTRRPFTIIEKSSGKIAGSMSMGNISLHDLRLEIGWSWLSKDFRGTDINRHAKYSMMKYAFDELNFERVEFKTDV